VWLALARDHRPDWDCDTAEQLLQLRTRTKKLAEIANYFPDPDPQAESWTGPCLHYKT
jgi:hypothetical protein